VKIILDTCVISETVRKLPDPGVLEWLEKQREQDLYLSVLTVGEIRKGIARLDDSHRKNELAAWVDGILTQRFESRLLCVDAAIASMWGKITAQAEMSGRKIPVIDGLIAATAKVHELHVATRNTKHLEACGVSVVNPWT